jgi:RnfABCDGE-type electron transport complex B subunit
MMTLIFAAVVLFGLTLAFAGLLGIAKEKLKVYEDPRIGEVNDVLPAANCGGCGFAGCADFAKAVVEKRTPCDGCPVGGSAVAAKIAAILGVEVTARAPQRPVVHCGAKSQHKKGVVQYDGVQTCAEANVIGVTQGCTYGCLGFGDCAVSCDHDAMRMVDGLPVIDYDKCIGDGACVRACPRRLIELIPFKQRRMLVVACSNKEPGKLVKQVCSVGCNGCKLCQKQLADLFEVKDNLAYMDYERYDHSEEELDKAVAKCPAKVIVYVGEPGPEHAKMLAAEQASEPTAVASGTV